MAKRGQGRGKNSAKSSADKTTSDGSGKDITKELEVNPDDVEIFKVEELAPPGAPITVPYLEVYRTNELEYIPYMSPYNVGVTSSSSDTSSSTTPTSTDPNASTDPNNPNSQSGSQSGSDSSSGSSTGSSSGSSSSS